MSIDIRSVDWSRVEHAYGPATDVPDAILALSSAKPAERKKACRRLVDAINHQGSITPAAIVAAPFLVDVALDPATKDRHALLVFLADLAAFGSHVAGLPDGCATGGEAFRAAHDDDPWKAIYHAVVRGIDGYLALLEGKEAPARSAAALLLAMLATEAERSLPVLRQRIATEKDEKARASALVALALLARTVSTPDADIDRLAAAASSESGLCKVAACLGLGSAAPSRLDAPAQSVLLAAIAANPKPLAGWPWCEGEVANHAALVLARVGAERSDAALLGQLLDQCKGLPTLPAVASAVLDVVFGSAGAKEMCLSVDLTDAQRAVVEKLVDFDAVMQTAPALAHHGLFSTGPALSRFLGKSPPGALDRTVSGEPTWRVLIRALNGRATEDEWIAAAIEACPTEPERVALGEDALRPTYPLVMPFPPAPFDRNERHPTLERLVARMLVQSVSIDELMRASDELLARERRPAEWGVTLALAMVEKTDTLAERFDRLVADAMVFETYATTVRAVLAHLTVTRRAGLVLPLKLETYRAWDDPQQRLRGRSAWLYLDLCPLPECAEKLASGIASIERVSLPEDRALEIFAAMGPIARAPIEAALAAGSPHADLLRRALQTLE